MSNELADVRLIGIPLDIQRIAAEHQDGLKREFAFLSQQAPDGEAVPSRLLTVSKELQERFQSFSAGPSAEMQGALDRGERSIDLTFRMPPAAGPACKLLADLLDEADAYCAAGKDLLTLVAPDEVVAYRNWLLYEFVRQLEGKPAVPWAEYQGNLNSEGL